MLTYIYIKQVNNREKARAREKRDGQIARARASERAGAREREREREREKETEIYEVGDISRGMPNWKMIASTVHIQGAENVDMTCVEGT